MLLFLLQYMQLIIRTISSVSLCNPIVVWMEFHVFVSLSKLMDTRNMLPFRCGPAALLSRLVELITTLTSLGSFEQYSS